MACHQHPTQNYNLSLLTPTFRRIAPRANDGERLCVSLLSPQDIGGVSWLALTEQRTENTSAGVSLPYLSIVVHRAARLSLAALTQARNLLLSPYSKDLTCPLLSMFDHIFLCFWLLNS